MRWTGHVARKGEKRNVYRLVGKPEGRRPPGRPRRMWLDNIRMDLVEVGWSDVDWIGLAQDRERSRALVNSVLNHRVQWDAGKLLSVQTTRDLSSSAQLHGVSYGKVISKCWVWKDSSKSDSYLLQEHRPEDGEIIQSPKQHILNKIQDNR
jgi:hypothetical protein